MIRRVVIGVGRLLCYVLVSPSFVAMADVCSSAIVRLIRTRTVVSCKRVSQN